MTNVTIQSGGCGFTVVVTAEKMPDGRIALSAETDCKMVRNMLAEIDILDRFTPLAGFQNNPVYRSAAKHVKHVACPVPSGILKALEVEAGLNVMKDATIVFDKKK